MNILFWLIVSTLVLTAFLFILPAFWRKHLIAPADLDQENIKVAKLRLEELKESKALGALSETAYEEQLADLELALSDDLDIKNPTQTLTNQGRWAVYVVIVFLPLLATGLYFLLGNYPAVSHTAEMSADPERAKVAEISKMVNRLAEKMKTNPEDGQGWLMLGRSYRALEQYPKAAEALANAYRILGDQPTVMLLYADALANVNDKSLEGKPADLVFKALSIEPNNLEALWLGGMARAQQGESAKATELWKKLEGLLPPDSDAQKQITGLLEQLAAESAAAPVNQKSTQTTATVNADLTVDVSLASELKNKVKPSDTVFIYAQAVSGPKMPLAIVRKQVSELPVSVTLNDTMAMTPAMKLSSFPQVKLLARISASGNAMPQAGDLIGSIESVALSDKTKHKIVINGAVK